MKNYPIVIMANTIEEAERNLTAIKALVKNGHMSGSGATSIEDAKALVEYVETHGVPTTTPTIGKTNRFSMEPRPKEDMARKMVEAMLSEYNRMDKTLPIDRFVERLRSAVREIALDTCIDDTKCDGDCSDCPAEHYNPFAEMFATLHEALTYADTEVCTRNIECGDCPDYDECMGEKNDPCEDADGHCGRCEHTECEMNWRSPDCTRPYHCEVCADYDNCPYKEELSLVEKIRRAYKNSEGWDTASELVDQIIEMIEE